MDTPEQSASISAAAHAYSVAMETVQPLPPPKSEPMDSLKDIAMADSTPERAVVSSTLFTNYFELIIL
jgi:hypothetical protein